MDLKELERRLEEATGPDRELDCALHVTLFKWKLAKVPADYDGLNECGVWRDPERDYKGIDPFVYPARGKLSPYFHVPDVNYTASLDAAVALCERVLPGWSISKIGHTDNKRWFAQLVCGTPSSFTDHVISEQMSTPALALCLALVRALSSGT